jgi:type IV pilus assembly protein PilE
MNAYIKRDSQVRSRGFTLVELMVTIAVVTILTAISVPSYTSQVRKARRMEARLALLDLATREERYFSTNSAYTAVAADLGYAGTFPQVVGSGYYQVSVCVSNTGSCGSSTTTTGSNFLLTATPVGTQANDTQCASFSLDSTGMQSATGVDTASCWGR